MTTNRTHLIAFAAMATSFAFAIACSGSSSSMTPTGPSTLAASSAATGANFSPNPTVDPCAADPVACTGRFTGGGFQIGDVKVTRGFTIHCDIRLTNNLEVNWGGSNNFHMEKEALTSVACDKPSDPIPPEAPVSRIIASSPGTCNGSPATINFILEDRGEPGRNDQAQLIISGGCTLNLPLSNLDGGNIQAHFDQPHK